MEAKKPVQRTQDPGFGQLAFSEELQCYVLEVEYFFQTRKGVIYMPEGGSVDMEGAVAFFSRIDDEVRRIDTYSGADRSTCYSKKQGGVWVTENGRR